MNTFTSINNFLHTSSFFYTISIGLDSTYIHVSPNYDRNFSLGRETLQGQHFSVTLHPEDVQICETVGPKCFEEPGKLFPVRLRKHDGEGGFVTTQWEMQAMFTEDGTPEGIFCIGYNITEFVQTQQKLDEAAQQFDEISFLQSHGVRKPLANIIGISHLLEDAETDAERKELTGLLNDSAAELDDVIREISGKGFHTDQQTDGAV